MYCWACGRELNDGTNYCAFCGEQQINTEQNTNRESRHKNKKVFLGVGFSLLFVVILVAIIFALFQYPQSPLHKSDVNGTDNTEVTAKNPTGLTSDPEPDAGDTENSTSESTSLHRNDVNGADNTENPDKSSIGLTSNPESGSTSEKNVTTSVATEVEKEKVVLFDLESTPNPNLPVIGDASLSNTCWKFCSGTTNATLYFVCFLSDDTFHMIQATTNDEITGEYSYSDGILNFNGDLYESDGDGGFISCNSYEAMGYDNGGFYRTLTADDMGMYWSFRNSEAFEEHQLLVEEHDYISDALYPLRRAAGIAYGKTVSELETLYGPIEDVVHEGNSCSYTFAALGDEIIVYTVDNYIAKVVCTDFDTATSKKTDETEFTNAIKHYANSDYGHVEGSTYVFHTSVEYESDDCLISTSLKTECEFNGDKIVCYSICFE